MKLDLSFLPPEYTERVRSLMGEAYVAGLEHGSMGVVLLATRQFVKDHPAFTMEEALKEIMAKCPEASISTVQQILSYLVGKGELVSHERGFVVPPVLP